MKRSEKGEISQLKGNLGEGRNAATEERAMYLQRTSGYNREGDPHE